MQKQGWAYFWIKSILLGAIVSLMLLVIVPDLRQGNGLSLSLFDKQPKLPEKVSFYDAIANAAPAVVNIYSTRNETISYFFRQRTYEKTSLGSGVVMDDRGFILTCYHVIKDAEQIIVSLQDGRFLEAHQVGFDIHTDLAVLKINDTNLPVVPQMEDPQSRIGDLVLAIGNPYNLGQTSTMGMISATGRVGLSNYFSSHNYADFLQTDVVLNEGNSGGALVDSNGYLVGINNANFKTLDNRRQVKDVNGVSFAVPYPLAKRVMDSIITHGRVIRGYLGINVEESIGREIIVTGMAPSGPAARSDLQLNDILVAINGRPLDSWHVAMDLVAESKPGDVLNFDVLRNNQKTTIPVTVGELSE